MASISLVAVVLAMLLTTACTPSEDPDESSNVGISTSTTEDATTSTEDMGGDTTEDPTDATNDATLDFGEDTTTDYYEGDPTEPSYDWPEYTDPSTSEDVTTSTESTTTEAPTTQAPTTEAPTTEAPVATTTTTTTASKVTTRPTFPSVEEVPHIDEKEDDAVGSDEDFYEFIKAEDLASDATWMADVGYGVIGGVSYTTHNSGTTGSEEWQWMSGGKKTSWNECIEDFDVKHYVDQIEETGAAYLIWFTQQADRYFCAPNATFDKIVGYEPGMACAERDLIMELAKEVKSRGMKFMLYCTADGPWKEVIPFSALCEKAWNTPTTQSYTWTDAFKKNWCAILQEFSLRYGDLVDGWWVDGADGMKYNNDQELLRISRALKSGNPNTVVCMNGGGASLAPRYYSSADDYAAGEADRFEFYPEDQFITGTSGQQVQWHILSYMNNAISDCAEAGKDTAEFMIDYVQKVMAKKGCVSIDLKNDRYGNINSEHLEIMKKVKAAIRG
ncbi:MAG: alpha-L-fucosidase [Clostridia bacterium]|nr:alpha-L-fucosidase [Clostridia bacterium]